MSSYAEWKEKFNKSRLWNIALLANPNAFVEKEISDKRMEICERCPELSAITKQCGQCSCFMLLKTKINISFCPLNKW